MNKYPKELRHPWVEGNSSVSDNLTDDTNAIPSVGFPSKGVKGKRHWTVDRRASRRQNRDMKYWNGEGA